MAGDVQSTLGSLLNGVDGAGVIVSAIDDSQRFIMHRLDAVFESHKVVAADLLKEIEFRTVDTIWSRTDGEADDSRVVEGFGVEFFEMLNRRVSIGVGLEINDESMGLETLFEIADGLLYLIFHWHPGARGPRREAVDVAVGAAAGRCRAVTVGAGESGVHGNFVDPGPEGFL